VHSRFAVLASGAGSNLQALLTHLAASGTEGGRVSLVASDRASAGALGIARGAGIATLVLGDPTDGPGILTSLDAHEIELVVLAGYLKRVPAAVTQRFRGRIVNIHPALLPAFGGPGMYGARVHDAVIASGARLSGATVHFVDEDYDHGPIIAQWPVPVLADDTPATLAARVLWAEHRLYPCAIVAVATGRVTLDHRNRVQGEVVAMPSRPSYTLQPEGETFPCTV
jgi:phosphoribosylglycinamide formyltransferase-1